MRLILALAILVCGAAAQWTMVLKHDPLHETSWQEWTLEGSYVVAPRDMPSTARPAIVVRCDPGRHNFGHTRGQFVEGYLYVGVVVDTGEPGIAGDIYAEFRLDTGKLQSSTWQHSTDYSSVFFGSQDFNNFLFGHQLPHKENTSPAVRKVMIGLQQFLGGEVEMEFDMPDPSEVGEACGVIWHKKADLKQQNSGAS